MSENTHNTQDFRVFSLSIEFLTTLYGLFMVIWGISISLISGSSSITSMIPAFIGVPLAFIGFISMIKPTFRKALMHIAVVIGIIAFLGGLDFFRGMFNNYYAGLSKLMLLITGFVYVYFCVQSFIFVRRQKNCLLYTSPSPRDSRVSRMPSSA